MGIVWVDEAARLRYLDYTQKADVKPPEENKLAPCCGGSKEMPQSQLAVEKPLSWTLMLKMFVQSIKYWKKAGYQLVDKKEHKRRYVVCKGCDSLVDYRCEKCGCFMFVKSKLAGMKCKENLW